MLYFPTPTINNEHVLYDLSLVLSECKVLALFLMIHSPRSPALLPGAFPSVLEQCTRIHHKRTSFACLNFVSGDLGRTAGEERDEYLLAFNQRKCSL